MTATINRMIARCALVAALLAPGAAAAGACDGVLPAAARPAGNFHLCTAAPAGREQTYACRAYRDGAHDYLVLFQGGPLPRGVYREGTGGGQERVLVWEPSRATARAPRCEPERPNAVPAVAAYSGTGVCHDESDRLAPCSLYEHSAARQVGVYRYFVFYDPAGSGATAVEVVAAGENRDALAAEIAFQLGRALLRTTCCPERAQAYLGYARELFPNDPVYAPAPHAPQHEVRTGAPARDFTAP